MRSAVQRRPAEQALPRMPTSWTQAAALSPGASPPFEEHLLGEAVLDRLCVAIAVVTTEGAISFANAAMRKLAATNDSVGIAPTGRLYFKDRSAELSFVNALADPVPHLTFAVRNATGDFGHLVTLAPLQTPLRSQIVMALTNLLRPSPLSHTEQLMHAFGLTRAERRLALFLVAGGRLLDAAKSFALSPHTVRNQLRTIFAKTGVRRQVDLARVLQGASSAVL